MKKLNLKTTVLEKKNKMLNITTNIQGLKELQKHIDFVESMLKMKTDIKFQDFIKDKVLELAKSVTDKYLIGGTTNDDAIDLYKSNHKIRDEEQGFILYNDTTIPVNAKDPSGYPENGFPVALAFEYGVGIVGQNSSNSETAWEYDVNNHGESGWVYVLDDDTWHRTSGYVGFEIYRHIAEEVNTVLDKWVQEYYGKEVK